MSNITWADKNNFDPKGTPDRTWSAGDANETKAAVNSKADNTPNLNGLSNLPVGTGFIRKTGGGTFEITNDTNNHYLGTYISLAALEAAHPTAAPGDEAIVDAGVGTDAKKYIWDDSDGAWVEAGGTGASSFSEIAGSPYDNAALNTALTDLDTGKQDVNSDLSAIAALTPTDNDLLQRKSGAWTNRTPAQVKTDLALTKADVGLSNVDNIAAANMPVSSDQSAAISAAQSAAISSANGYTDTAVSGAIAGLKWKSPGVKAATTVAGGNITLSGAQTIDGISIVAGDRVLVKNQTTQSQNGIYVAAAGAWTRSADADTAAELEGAIVSVEQGTTNADTSWRQTTDNITLGSSNIVWGSFGAAAPPASESTAGIAEIATDAEALTTDDARIMTPLKVRNKNRAKTTGTISFSVDSANDQITVQVTPAADITCTINSAAADVIVPILNFGSGNVNFTAGLGVTITGIQTLTPDRGCFVKYTSATTAKVVGGSTTTFANVTAKPTTVVGYGITDATRPIFSTGSTINSVGTTETTIGTGNIPANTLNTDLGHLRAVFVGQLGASANNKTLKVKLGATTIFDSGAMPATGATDFEIQIKIMRTAVNAQRGSVTLYSGSGVVSGMKYFTSAESLDTLLALAVTGTVASPGGTEISGNMFYALKEGI